MPGRRFFLATEPPSIGKLLGRNHADGATKCKSMFSLLSLHTTWQLRHLAAHFRAPDRVAATDSPCLGYFSLAAG